MVAGMQQLPTTRSELVRRHIIQDGTARAWLRAHSGGAEFAARLNSNSQPSAELAVLFPKTSRRLHAAFFKDNFVALQHGAASQRYVSVTL
jgi:hypothetical protein